MQSSTSLSVDAKLLDGTAIVQYFCGIASSVEGVRYVIENIAH